MLIFYNFIFYKNRIYFNNKKNNIALTTMKKIETNLLKTNYILLYNNIIILLINCLRFYI